MLLVVLVPDRYMDFASEAAVRTTPLAVTEKGQTIDDDFDVTIGDGRTQSVLTITANAASSRDDETTVRSQSIQGHYTKENEYASGIRVLKNHPAR